MAKTHIEKRQKTNTKIPVSLTKMVLGNLCVQIQNQNRVLLSPCTKNNSIQNDQNHDCQT